MSTSETLRTGATTMYQTIHSYDRYFAQAARIDAIRNAAAVAATATVPAPAKLTGKVEAEHHLERPGYVERYIFKVAGEQVAVRFHVGHVCTEERVVSREAAREEYRALVKRGYVRW